MKTKKLAIVSVCVALAGIIAAGATMAYLNTNTATVTNTFTPSGSNLSIQLREPAWDGYTFADADYTTLGASAKAGLSADAVKALGITKANPYAPGSVIPKDPTVKNNGNAAVWVAVKLEYTSVPDYAVINYEDGTEWEFNADKTIAYRKVTLAAGATTASVFDQVTIPATVTELGDTAFTVKSTAYAIQTENIADLAAAKAAFAAQFPTVFG